MQDLPSKLPRQSFPSGHFLRCCMPGVSARWRLCVPGARHAAALSESVLQCTPISRGFMFRGAECVEHCLAPKGHANWAVWEHIRKNPGDSRLQTSKPFHTNQAPRSTLRIPRGFPGHIQSSSPSGLPLRVAGKPLCRFQTSNM